MFCDRQGELIAHPAWCSSTICVRVVLLRAPFVDLVCEGTHKESHSFRGLFAKPRPRAFLRIRDLPPLPNQVSRAQQTGVSEDPGLQVFPLGSLRNPPKRTDLCMWVDPNPLCVLRLPHWTSGWPPQNSRASFCRFLKMLVSPFSVSSQSMYFFPN